MRLKKLFPRSKIFLNWAWSQYSWYKRGYKKWLFQTGRLRKGWKTSAQRQKKILISNFRSHHLNYNQYQIKFWLRKRDVVYRKIKKIDLLAYRFNLNSSYRLKRLFLFKRLINLSKFIKFIKKNRKKSFLRFYKKINITGKHVLPKLLKKNILTLQKRMLFRFLFRCFKYLIAGRFDNIGRIIYFKGIFRWHSIQLFKRKRFGVLYVRAFEYFFKKFYSNQASWSPRHLRILLPFYSVKSGKGLLKFFRESIRYAYIKKKLARFGKKFKRNKSFSISRKRFILNPQNSLRPLPKHEQFLLFRLFFHLLIKHGNNRIALKILVEVVNLMKMRYGVNFFNNFVKVIEKIRPLLMYRTMYVGGKKYRIPIIIQREKSYKVGVNLLVNNSKKEINPAGRLFEDISLVVKNKGTLIKSWNDYHSLVFENKSYTRFLRFLKSGLI